MHKIVVPAYVMENLPDPIETEQRLLVCGLLKSKPFTLDNGKIATAFQILAKQIYICDNENAKVNEATTHLGTNVNDGEVFEVCNELEPKCELRDHICVNLESFIWSEIYNEDKVSSFNLAMRYDSKYVNDSLFVILIQHILSLSLCIMCTFHFRNSDGVINDCTDIISIFAYDDLLRHICRKQLKRLDRVRIEGHIKYKIRVDDTNKKRYGGYIHATRITKLMSIQKGIDCEDVAQTDSKQINC